jgi:hypothetical protein
MQLGMVPLISPATGFVPGIVGGYALAIGICAAVWCWWLWWQTRQRESAAELSRRARAVWSRQLGLALQHPELAEPMPGSLADATEVVRYHMYVASLLSASEEILDLDPSEAWQETLATQLSVHRSYLSSEEFRRRGLLDCSEAMGIIVSRVIGT